MSKKLIAGLGSVAALGLAIAPALSTSAVETYITATVDPYVGCQSTNDTASTAVAIGNIPAGQQKSGTFTLTGSTNKPEGFTMTGTPDSLRNGSYTIGYSATAVEVASEGWFATSSSEGATIGSTIVLNSGSLSNTREASWGVTATVSTATTTTTGTYTGTIEWVCQVNQ